MALQSDHGWECLGELYAYLKYWEVSHYLIVTHNPCANGQIEYCNRSVKVDLHKFASVFPDRAWWYHLGNVAQWLRLFPVRATGFSLFVLIYKKVPQLLLPMALQVIEDEELVN